MNNQTSIEIICPHLGLRNDATTSAGYPSMWNVCFHAKGKPTPELEYQQTTCLTAKHHSCPVYKSPQGVILPDNIRQPKEQFKLQKNVILLALLVFILVIGAILGFRNRELLSTQLSRIIIPAWQQTQRALPATLPPTATIEIIPTETVQPTTTPTSTPEPTPSPTMTSRPPISVLGTPIGQDIKFQIIRVNEGDALGQYATRYNTSEAAIRAVNYNMPSVLFIDLVLVIPLNTQDTSGFPAFEPIQIQEGGISIEMFAQQLQVDLEEIYFYNEFLPGRILQPREWVLIPRD
jgi:hypothetical protein